ncbi:EAL domain-containing protein [Ureibacillus chungkukjangi]|uniref:EAL domain-containing protein n=1 Tax=Ureibacillus chungkukjangi TaxID=1202712 RepID=UPI00203E3287|nr:EAL domain-containing protein [Ureibacillus chungkukjangi]MCM3389876.1 EAL domain-containing protein [Ureibacillus chungkukjangi]
MLSVSKLMEERAFYNVYQPLMDSESGEIFAYEALLRTTPFINPEIIFNYGRDEGLLFKFDSAAISNAIKEFPYSFLENYFLFINVFPSTIVHPNFKNFIENISHNYPKIKYRIVFEINEASCEKALWKEDVFSECLQWLNYIGFKIAFDDITFNHFPVDFIENYKPDFVKLDRSCSKNLSESIEKQVFIINLLSKMQRNTYVVLEGIETKEDFQIAKEIGVPYLQGYYISKPHRI